MKEYIISNQPKRDARKNKEYVKGALKARGDKLKEDYGKINFKDRAIARWNKTTAPTKKRRRQAPNPFGNIRGLAGFGSRPQLTRNKNEK